MVQDFFADIVRVAGWIDRGQYVAPDVLANIPPHRKVFKPAAAALILPKSVWQKRDVAHEDTPFLLGRNAKTHALEVIGGARDSVEEKAFASLFTGAEFPMLKDGKTQQPVQFAGAFYHLQAIHMLAHDGAMCQVNYLDKNGENDLMAALREAIEEGVVRGLQIQQTFAQSQNFGLAFRPTNPNIRRALEPRFPDLYDNEQVWAAQVVQQYGFLATVDVEPPDLPEFQPNAEVNAVEWVTGLDLFRKSALKSTFFNQKAAGAQIRPEIAEGAKEVRNSIPLHLLKWYMEWCIINF